ncbi:UTP--glucose-1-phosphate uridylyltransferase [subsurface metagenome]
MKAIILAAGYATRLYPLTENFPKTLLPIAGKAILEYTLEKLSLCRDIDTIYLVTNNKFFHIFNQKIPRSISQAVEIINDKTNSNEDRLGSIGDLWFVIESKKLDDDLLIICSDKMFEFSLVDFVVFFKTRREAVNLCFDTEDLEKIPHKHGCVVIDKQGRIVKFQEKPGNPGSSFQSIAFYIYPREIIPLIRKYLSEGNNKDAPGFLAQWMCQRVAMYAYFFKEECYDVGTPESYQAVNEIYCRKLDRKKR